MRRVVFLPLMLGLFLGGNFESTAQTLPPPTVPPQIFIVITPTPEIWPTETLPPTATATPTETLTPTATPAYADLVAYATVQYGDEDAGRLTAFRYEMSAGDVLNAALLACVLGLLLLDVLLKLVRRGK